MALWLATPFGIGTTTTSSPYKSTSVAADPDVVGALLIAPRCSRNVQGAKANTWILTIATGALLRQVLLLLRPLVSGNACVASQGVANLALAAVFVRVSPSLLRGLAALL